MVDRVQFEAPETGPNAPAPQETAPQIPDKFKNADGSINQAALLKSYTELEAEATRLRQTKGAQQEKPPAETPPAGSTSDAKPDGAGTEKKPDDEKKPADQQSKEDEAAQKVVQAAGIDVTPYQEEFDSTGDVSEENRAKIADALKGILGENARQAVDQFIEGRRLIVQNDRKLYMDAAGGEERYQQMTQWAAQSLPREEIEAFNRQVSSGDRHATLFAIEGLRAKFEKSGAVPPRRLMGGGGPVGNATAFKSSAEMVAAMSDPRYQTDEAYRQQVAARLAVSNF